MKKRGLVQTSIAILFVGSVILGACAPAAAPAPTPTKAPPAPAKAPPAAPPTPAVAKPAVPSEMDKPLGNIPMGGGPSGGTFFPITARIAYLVSKYGKDAKATSSSTGGSPENAKLVGTGEAFFALTAADVVYYARLGQREFKEAYPDIRSVTAGFRSVAHMGVNADSPIRAMADFKGKSLGVGTAGSSNAQAAIELLSMYGITEKDVTLKFIAIPDAINGLKDRTIDAAFQMIGPPGAAWIDITTSHDIRLLGMEEQKVKDLNAKFPYFTPATIKGGAYKGNPNEIKTFGVVNLLATNVKVPEHVVYNVVKIILERTDELAEAHPLGKDFNLENAKYATAIPLHPGAEKYLRERGVIK